MWTMIFGTVMPWLLVGIGAWFGYQLARQNGRILLRLDSIDLRLARKTPQKPNRNAQGLPVGAVAPDFELPVLAGGRRRLADYRGQNLLLIFFNPQCGFCSRMAADLAALPQISGKRKLNGEWTEPVIISTGDLEENRRFFAEHHIRCDVLLQEQMQVASRFGVNGTPMGYLIDGSGKISSEVTVGADALLQLAGSVALPAANNILGTNGSAKKHQKNDPSLAKSRINRNGLKAGTPAPEFTLPRIDGSELSLATFRGGRVLIVFSDPDCGPCDDLAPLLQELHEQQDDLQVLVVSRRDADAARAKADKFGLTYPIVVQKQWEISLKYGMFATPIGYLIDEQGILLSDVAIGVQPILALADRQTEDSYDEDPLLIAREQALAN